MIDLTDTLYVVLVALGTLGSLIALIASLVYRAWLGVAFFTICVAIMILLISELIVVQPLP